MIRFEEALEECIEALHGGATVSDCLSRYPDYADRLTPLLSVAQELYAVPQARLSAAGFEQQRTRLHEHLQARARPSRNGASPAANGHVAPERTPLTFPTPRPTPALQPVRRPWAVWGSRRMALLAAVLILAVVATLSSVTLASAKAAPTEPLYPVKRIVENVVAWLPADTGTRAERELNLAAERLADSRLVCGADPTRAATYLDEMRRHRDIALKLIENMTDETGERLRRRVQALQTEANAVVEQCNRTRVTPTLVAPTIPPVLVAPAMETVTSTPAATATSLPLPSATPRPPTSIPPTTAPEQPTAASAPAAGPNQPQRPAATQVPPSAVPPTSTPAPATATPAESEAPPTKPPAATSAPTSRPQNNPPTATPQAEPRPSSVPTDPPRPTEPPPPPNTPVPVNTPFVPPSPTSRVLEITKVPTQPPQPTSFPLGPTPQPSRPTATPKP